MDEDYKKYCRELFRSGNYSESFIREAVKHYCPNLDSMKELVKVQNLSRRKSIPIR